MEYTIREIMGLIDFTNLFSYTTENEIKSLIDDAAKFSTYAVCINPIYREFAKNYITRNNLPLKLAVVVDFPFGSLETADRVDLIKRFGKVADELDIVTQLGAVKSEKFEGLEKDVSAVVSAAHEIGKSIKIITEDAHLTLSEKEKVYDTICASEADLIKTSTGFERKEYASTLQNEIGAQPENVKLMAERSKKFKSKIGIKVSGGVRTYDQIKMLLELAGRGTDPRLFRVGCSKAAVIYKEMVDRGLKMG